MELKKVGKYNGANEYEVFVNDNLSGYLYKEKYEGSGRWSAQYTGHFKSGYNWEFQPKNPDAPVKRFVSLQEAKSYLNNL